jgi:hypothetical protein
MPPDNAFDDEIKRLITLPQKQEHVSQRAGYRNFLQGSVANDVSDVNETALLMAKDITLACPCNPFSFQSIFLRSILEPGGLE